MTTQVRDVRVQAGLQFGRPRGGVLLQAELLHPPRRADAEGLRARLPRGQLLPLGVDLPQGRGRRHRRP